MKRSFSLILVLLTINAFSNTENEFWAAYKKGDNVTAALIGEKLGETNLDYLYLSAICNHNNYDYDAYYEKSDYYHEQKQNDYASLETLLAKNFDQKDPALNNLMGMIKHLIPGIRLNSAQSYFETSITLKSNNPIAHNYLSMIFLKNNEFDKAIEMAQLAIKEDNTYPEPYNNLAFSYYKQGDKAKATAKLLECMKMCPKNTSSTYINFIQLSCKEIVLLVHGQMMGVPGFNDDAARDHVITELAGKNGALLRLADQFYRFNSYKEVDLILNKMAIDQPNKAQFYNIKAVNSLMAGDTTAHEKSVDKLVELKEFDDVLNIAVHFYENQNWKFSLNTLKKAETIAFNSENKMKVFSNMGAIDLQLGNYDAAITTFEKALKLNEKDDITLTNIGISYASKKDLISAKKYLLKAKANCRSQNQMKAIDHWLLEIEK